MRGRDVPKATGLPGLLLPRCEVEKVCLTLLPLVSSCLWSLPSSVPYQDRARDVETLTPCVC